MFIRSSLAALYKYIYLSGSLFYSIFAQVCELWEGEQIDLNEIIPRHCPLLMELEGEDGNEFMEGIYIYINIILYFFCTLYHTYHSENK